MGADAFPNNASEHHDLDGDGLGDAIDVNMDGDGSNDDVDVWQKMRHLVRFGWRWIR